MRARRVTFAALTTFGAAAGLVPAAAHADTGATTLHVNNAAGANCSDAAGTPGTVAQPFCTITHAAAVVTAGQTVLVEPGTYTEENARPQASGTPGAPIVFAADGPGVFVHSQLCGYDYFNGGAFDIVGQHDITVRDFDITVCSGVAIDAHTGSNIVITGNKIHDPATVNTGSGGSAMVALSDVAGGSFTGNKIDMNDPTSFGVTLYGGASGITVSGNTITGQGNGPTFPPPHNSQVGIASDGPDNKIVDNVVNGMSPAVQVTSGGVRNQVVQNYAPCGVGGIQVAADDVAVTSNTVVANDQSLYTVSGTVTGVTVKDNVGEVHDQYVGCGPVIAGPDLVGLTVAPEAAGGVTVDYNSLGIAGWSYMWAGTGYSTPADLAKAGIHQGAHDLIDFAGLDPNGVPTSGWSPVDSADATAPGFQKTDILGHARYDDTNTPNTGTGTPAFADRGAFEYQGVVNPNGPFPIPPQPTPPVTPPVTPPPTVPPTSGPSIGRIAGPDRYTTGIAASSTQWQTGQAKAVVLARGGNFPDALSGVPLAAHQHGPLLLTDTTSLSPAVSTEIRRVLGTDTSKTVYILGGTGAINGDVEKAVRALGYKVVRYGGADRFSTALQVAQSFGPTKHVVVATGLNFPDALSAGPLGAAEDAPIVLSQDRDLDPATAAFVKTHAAIEAVGGQADSAVTAHVGTAGKTYQALYGGDRYATSAKVAGAVIGALGHAPTGVGVASGMNFPDALTGGAFAANAGEPLLLTDPAQLPDAIGAELAALAAHLRTVTVFGGPSAVSNTVVTEIAARVGGH
ncbi:MAG: hypothetical protein HOW97_06305 [Catenulispora sp.]|nr:hypothetical protein [Catenulispora sp.]